MSENVQLLSLVPDRDCTNAYRMVFDVESRYTSEYGGNLEYVTYVTRQRWNSVNEVKIDKFRQLNRPASGWGDVLVEELLSGEAERFAELFNKQCTDIIEEVDPSSIYKSRQLIAHEEAK